ncbi:synaptotagmin-like protein 2 [Amia ocellicauda]|uniref:synaptotagmin-like protein 2 n=1 Tax=Amia ocellicauda TaxID=2972642 RepID=UPI0034639FBA
MKPEGGPVQTLDLSFLSAEEEAAVLHVLNRDDKLRKEEDGRVRQLRLSVSEPRRLKILTGEWFDEMKSKRYGKVSTATDIVRSSFNRRKHPATQGNLLSQVGEEVRSGLQPDQQPPLRKTITPAGDTSFLVGDLSALPREIETGKLFEELAKDFDNDKACVDQPEKRDKLSSSDTEWDSSNAQRPLVSPSERSPVYNYDAAQSDNLVMTRSPLDSSGSLEESGKQGMLENSKDSENMLELSTLLFLTPGLKDEKFPGENVNREKSRTPLITDQDKQQVISGKTEAQDLSYGGERQEISQDLYSFPDPTKGLCYDIEFQDRDTLSVGSSWVAEKFSSETAGQRVLDSSAIVEVEGVPQAPGNDIQTNNRDISAKEFYFTQWIADRKQQERFLPANKPELGYSPRAQEKEFTRTSCTLETTQKSPPCSFPATVEDPGTPKIQLFMEARDSKTKEGTWEEAPQRDAFFIQTQDLSLEGLHSLDVLEFALPSAHSTPEKDTESQDFFRFDPGNTFNESDSIQRMRSGEEEPKIVHEDSPEHLIDISDVKQALFSLKGDDSQIPLEVLPSQTNENMEQNNTFALLQPEPISNIFQYDMSDIFLKTQPSMPADDSPTATKKGKIDMVPSIVILSPESSAPVEAAEAEESINTPAMARWATSALEECESQPAVINASSEGFAPDPLAGATTAVEVWEESTVDLDDDLNSVSTIGSDASAKKVAHLSSLLPVSGRSASMLSLYSDAGDFGDFSVQGAIEFAIQYSGKRELVILVQQCEDLAIANTRKQRTDPYVKTYLYPDRSRLSKRKTSIKKNTLNPVFQESLKYKIDKVELQTRTLNLSVWHNDSLGRNAFLGEVEIDLKTWDWKQEDLAWYSLQPKTPETPDQLGIRGQLTVALKYVPAGSMGGAKPLTGELHIWLKEARNLQKLKPSGVDSFVKCYVLPDTSKKSRQKTRVVKKDQHPAYNHTMVYDGFRHDEIREACCELTLWDHDTFTNQFLGGVRLSLGTGKSYGKTVDWMDSAAQEADLWKDMLVNPCKWVEKELPLRPSMAKTG